MAVTLLGPVLAALAVAAAVCLVLQGRPVLFVQERVGRHGALFRLVKLRTMTGPPSRGRAYREQHRLTGCGLVLRRLGVDELPQLLHLLTGRMSLVGPRPLLAEHVDPVAGSGRRHEVRPGFTCYAQLELAEHGYLDRYRQIRLDEEYIERMSLRADLAILRRTAGVLLGRRYRLPLARFEPDRAGWPARPVTAVTGDTPPTPARRGGR